MAISEIQEKLYFVKVHMNIFQTGRRGTTELILMFSDAFVFPG